jgi:hypothetical protein
MLLCGFLKNDDLATVLSYAYKEFISVTITSLLGYLDNPINNFTRVTGNIVKNI